MEIKNLNDVRSTISLLTASCNSMCNTNDINVVIDDFLKAKEYIIALYKYNVQRVSPTASQEK